MDFLTFEIDISFLSSSSSSFSCSNSDIGSFEILSFNFNKSSLSDNSSDDMDYSKWGLIELEPLSKIKKITGSNMANAWATIPQVTQFDNADISNLYKSYKRLKKGTSIKGLGGIS